MGKRNFNTTLRNKRYKDMGSLPILVSTEITPRDSTAQYVRITHVGCFHLPQSAQGHS